MAFISSAKNSSGNEEVNTTSISTASTQVSPTSANIAAASISLDTTCAYIASQSNGSQIKYKDINQIDKDDIEEMDIKWNIALLSMRAGRFWKKTGKKISIQGTDVAGFDKSKDWSYMENEDENHALVVDKEAPTKYALMAKSISENKIRGLEFNVESKNNRIERLTNELEELKKEKEGLDSKLTGFQSASKDLDTLLGSQKTDKNKEDDTITDYSRPSPSIESISNDLQSSNSSVFENEESTISIFFKPEIKFVKAADSPTDNSQNNINDKCYWDSGCSRHMTGNISYLSDYEPFDGGYIDFKLKDDTNMLLRNPRQHNMYSINLNNVVPHKDLTCLVAKAFADESMLSHRRLVRNMLAHAKLPVTFLAEAVNTACYVQNRVLVNKSQNKTPYELFNGKFDAKGDEGYFIGYSMSSKAYRVFNKRTKRVEDNLHVDFLENKLMEKGAGPNWLFNIDILTNFMNYVPVVVVETSSTNFSGTKEAASQDVKKDVSSLRYIALSNWFHKAHLESSTSNAQDACNVDARESNGNFNPTATSTNPPADQIKTLIVETPIPTVSLPVLTAILNDSPEPSSDIRLISKRVICQDETPSLDNITTLANRFEDILRVTITTVDTNEVEADVSNMESSIPASPTLTHRIHKDHPKSQIIGLVDTPIQTRHKSKEMEEQTFIATIYQKITPDLLQFCLFSCFLSQEEPKNIFDALKDPSWVRPIGTKWVLKNKKDEKGIVIRNKAGLVAQGHTQEEGIDYKEVFAPVARIKAIGLFLAYASFIGFTVYHMDVKSAFLYGTIDEEVYVMQPPGFYDPQFPDKVYKVEKAMGTIDQTLFIRKRRGDFLLVQVTSTLEISSKKFGYSDVRSANTPMDKENTWGKDGLVKRIFRYLKVHPKLGLWYPKESPFDLVAYSDSDYGGAAQDRKSTTGGNSIMARLAFCDYHNMIVILEKYEHNRDFHQIVDFVEASHIRRNLKLNDEAGISSLPDTELFENLTLMGPKSNGFNEFSTNIASAMSKFSGRTVPLFDSMLVTMGEGSGTLTKPHHIPTPEAQQSPPTTYSSPSLPPATTKTILTVTPTDIPTHRQYHRRARIAQSSALPTATDEPASPFGDGSQEEAFPTVSGLEAEQDRKNIIKTSALPHDSSPRARIKLLEDKDGGGTEPSREDAIIKGRSLETGEEAGIKRSTERGSNDTEELVTVLTSLDAASILTSGVQVVSVPPATDVATVGFPTGSGLKMVALDTPKKKKLQEQIDIHVAREIEEKMAREDQRSEQIAKDAEIARIHAEEELQMLIDGLDRNNEVIAKHLQEYKQATNDLTIGEKIEFINELYSKSTIVGKQNTLEHESTKKMKTSKDVSEEDLKEMMQLFLVEEVYMEGLQIKHPIIDWKIHTEGKKEYWKSIRLGGNTAVYQFLVDMLKHFDREDLNQLWTLVKETLSIRYATSDKEKELWVEWRLYDSCGVHHVLSKDQEIFMQVHYQCHSRAPIGDPKDMEFKKVPKEMEHGIQILNCDETLKDLMKMEYTHVDGDVFVVYSWKEFSLLKEMCTQSGEFFSTMYFERGVDKTKIMTEKCIWFRLCGEEHVLTLPEFVVLLGLYEPSDMKHRFFDIHFNNLEINDNGFDHNEYWKKIREPTRTNKRTSLVQDPLMRIMHKLLVGALVHRTESRERCQKPDL
uniref:Uncharacterized protein n=1 Tax=Tanacetum cinerariifolium TaxID=118510 RepID=A0A699HA59_TANCI|nr:hypothetical protein [Tanacetum cinerariifolium]